MVRASIYKKARPIYTNAKKFCIENKTFYEMLISNVIQVFKISKLKQAGEIQSSHGFESQLESLSLTIFYAC